MSRKGKLPIPIPKGVEVKITDSKVSVKGPKGVLEQSIMNGIIVRSENEQILVTIDEKAGGKSSFQGLYRTLIENMVLGTTQGFSVELTMIGVGYRAAVKGKMLDLQIGVSHPCEMLIPEGIEIKVEKNVNVTVSGIDKQQVGQFAAIVRAKRPPEPYKGKGIRYKDEYVRKKAGKAAK